MSAAEKSWLSLVMRRERAFAKSNEEGRKRTNINERGAGVSATLDSTENLESIRKSPLIQRHMTFARDVLASSCGPSIFGKAR